MNALKKLFRAIGALIMLAAILVGLPWALLRYGNWPITSLPTKEWLRHLNEPVSDSTLYDALTVAVWCLWAIFSFSVLVEFGSQLRGIRPPRIALLGPVQTAARGLVAAVLVTVTIHQGLAAAINASPAFASSAGRMPVAEQTVQLERPAAPTRSHGAPTHTTPVARSDTATVNPGGTVTVDRGDNAWSIAVRHLGDGMRWRELWDLNHGVEQADGRAWIDQQVLLRGWILRLPGPQPAQESSTSASTMASSAGTHEYVVVRGDNLSDIAEDQLGDETRYREIYDLSRDTDQPGHRHLTDPNLILPGWKLTIPGSIATPTPPVVSAPATPVTPPPAEDAPDAPPATVPTVPTVPVVSEPASSIPTTVESAPSTAPAVSTTPTTAAPSTVASAPAWPAPASHETTERTGTHRPSLPLILGVGSSLVLASALSVRMALLRKSRIARGLRDNRLIERNAATIRTVVRAADVPLVKWAAHHLSYLILGLDRRSLKAVPEAVELSEDAGIEILWSDKEPVAPQPWRAIDGGAAWRIDYDPDAPTPGADRSAGISALVTIGHREGRQLLIDLEAFGSIAIDGPPDRVDALLRSVVLELAAGDDLANAYIEVVGMEVPGRTLTRLKQTSIDDATSSLQSWAQEIDGLLAQDREPTAFHYRLGNDFPTEAYIAVVADREADVTELVATPAGRAVAAVLAGTHRDAGCQIQIAEDGAARIEPLGIDFTAATLQSGAEQIIGDTLTELVELLKPPRLTVVEDRVDDAIEATPADATDDEMDAVGMVIEAEPIEVGAPEFDATTAALPECIRPKLLVKIFGVPCVPARPKMGRREIFTTVVVACHDGPITSSIVQDSLYADHGIRQKTLNNVIGYTRSALGKFDDGTEIFPDRHQRQLAVAEGVKTDLAVLKKATKLAESMSSAEAIVVLDAAHQLITGPPFDANGYDWAHEKQFYREATDAINDATVALVDCALLGEAIDVARSAVNRAFRAIDVHEPLYRLRMRIEHGAGNLGGASAAYDELGRHLMDIDMEPSDETLALAAELFGRRRVMPN